MIYTKLAEKLRNKLFFGIEDVAGVLDIKRGSAAARCKAYADSGMFVRLKKNTYTLKERWLSLERDDFLRIANVLQVPSYVSLATALSYYGITTQVQRGYYESVCLRKTASYRVEGIEFVYRKTAKKYYSGFGLRDRIFIASAEKAFLDAVYLSSMGKYSFDIDAADTTKLDKSALREMMNGYPGKTRKEVKEKCRI